MCIFVDKYFYFLFEYYAQTPSKSLPNAMRWTFRYSPVGVGMG